MCEANAYIIKEGNEELLMESVETVEPEGDGTWNLKGIFGDQKTVKGRLQTMNLLDHKIVFKI